MGDREISGFSSRQRHMGPAAKAHSPANRAKHSVTHEISNKCFTEICSNRCSLQDGRRLSQYKKLWDKLLLVFAHHDNMWVITPADGYFK